jgi:RNA polymerase sigma-70 factor (ECF subfamily)
VARLLAGVGAKGRDLGVTVREAEINGQPGAIVVDASGRLISVLTLEIAGGLVQTVRGIVNPDKLRHLGELADIREVVGGRQIR